MVTIHPMCWEMRFSTGGNGEPFMACCEARGQREIQTAAEPFGRPRGSVPQWTRRRILARRRKRETDQYPVTAIASLGRGGFARPCRTGGNAFVRRGREAQQRKP